MGFIGTARNYLPSGLVITLGLLLQCFISSASAYQPALDHTIPEPLKPWRDWVLQEQPNHPCPFKADQFSQRHCVWPAYLALNAGKTVANFQMRSFTFAPGWLMLPGGEGFWPKAITVNGESAQPVEVAGRPALFLEPGEYRIEGIINWQRLPDHLFIPPNTGLVSLTVNGRVLALPRREGNGQLWLVEKNKKQNLDVEDKLGLSVFRHLKDGVPFQVTTEVRLEVSGRPREVLLGVVRLPDFDLLDIDSPLPVRVEQDGRLRIRLRPGSWTLRVKTRHSDDVQRLPLPEVDAVWPSEELWSFEPRPEFRQVRIEGAESVDPAQTRIPQNWMGWKAYRVIPGQVLRLVTMRRGDPEPAPNRLELNRTAWVAFSGDSLTFRDNMNGTLSRHWRLNAIPGYQLGHVTSYGEPNVVTELNGQLGVELRKTPVSLQAVGKIPGAISRQTELAVTGWQQDFEHLSLDLNMPPGWRLFAATGADHVQNAWLNRWQVWDVFLLLITTAALVRLRGFAVGLVSGVAFFLIYPEQPVILWLWLNMIAVFALLSVLKSGSLHRISVAYGRLSALALIAVCLPFLVSQARMALYPQLERGYYSAAASQYQYDQAPEFADEPQRARREVRAPALASMAMEGAAAPREIPERIVSKMKPSSDNPELVAMDPNTAAQTGPSVPDWHWNQSRLRWSGPVTTEQTVTLYFLKPPDTRIAAVLRVALLLVIALGLFKGWRFSGLGFRASHTAGLVGMIPFALALWSMAPSVMAADSAQSEGPAVVRGAPAQTRSVTGFPSEKMLDTLRSRLVKASDCSPKCVAANRAQLSVSDGRMNLNLEYQALEHVQVPLPGAPDQWLLDTVTMNGETAAVRKENNRLWVALAPGKQQVQMSGRIGGGETVQLLFPEPVYNLSVSARGWTLRGIDNGRISGGALTLEPLDAQAENSADSDRLPPNVIDPFVRVDRFLQLGLNWYVETRITRMAPARGAIKLDVPLIPGESVTTQNVTVKNGLLQVVLNPEQQQFQWYSSLDKTGEIHLTAPEDVPWVERWHIQAASLWHVDLSGIAPVKAAREQDRWQPQWQPLPGETANLNIVRPKAAEGATTTIDHARLKIEPGRQDTSYSLTLALRSSKGTEQRIRLDEKARILSVTLDDKTQPSQEQGTHLVVPINPGQHHLNIRWRQPTDAGLRQTGPDLEVDGKLSNLEMAVDVPRSQWVLLVGGPRMGPAVLVWGELLVVILLAFALARIPGLPLKTYEWVLLAVGLCAGFLEAGILVVLWFVALRKRQQLGNEISARWFNLYQMFLVLLTFVAVVVMVGVIPMGLMQNPDMGIVGNGSSHYQLRWYLDQSDGVFPNIWWLSLPLWCYRLLMLVWSLWLAVAILRWLKWAWQCFSTDGLWRKAPATGKTAPVEQEEVTQDTPRNDESGNNEPGSNESGNREKDG